MAIILTVITLIYSPLMEASAVTEMAMAMAIEMSLAVMHSPMTLPNGMIPMVMALVTTTRPGTTMVTFALPNTPLLRLKEHGDAQILIVMALSTR